jgi:membrane protease YdiL (CAAX protease family)
MTIAERRTERDAPGPVNTSAHDRTLLTAIETLAEIPGLADRLHDALAVALVAFAIRLPLGIALGWLWVRRQSLLATITLHAAYNTLLVLAAFSV